MGGLQVFILMPMVMSGHAAFSATKSQWEIFVTLIMISGKYGTQNRQIKSENISKEKTVIVH